MSSLEDKRYIIDPEEGEKRDTCPSYSCFEDGRDAKSGIIPPKDYIFIGFRFDPQCSDKEFNGTLHAEYEKVPLWTRLKQNYGKLFTTLILSSITLLIILLVLGVFKEKEPIQVVQPSILHFDDSLGTGDSQAVDTTATPNHATDLNPSNTTKNPYFPLLSQHKESDKNTLFKNEFWDLIHRQEKQMDAYTDLYNKYKGNVKGEEYNYLRFTILKDYTNFKRWQYNLKKIPEDQLQTIKSIDVLKNEINS